MTEKKKPSAQRKAPAQRAPVEHTPSGEAPAPLETEPVFKLPTDGSLGDPLLPSTRIALGLAKPCPVCGTAKPHNRCEVCGHQEHDT